MIPIAVVVKERVFLYNIGCALLWVSTTVSVFILYLPKFYYIGKLTQDDIKLFGSKQSKPSGSDGSSNIRGPQAERGPLGKGKKSSKDSSRHADQPEGNVATNF